MTVNEFEQELTAHLEFYSTRVTEKINRVTKQVANDGKKKIATVGGYKDRTGKYRKSFRIKAVGNYRAPRYKLYSAAPHYRLTHLLEDGHKVWNAGKNTAPRPHWEETEKFMIEEYEKRISEELSEE